MKRSSSWIAVLPSLVIPVCFGLIMYLGLSYLIQEGQISNDTVLRYLTGHPVSKVTVGMFFIGLASLALIASNLVEQFSSEPKITFKTKGLADSDLDSDSATEADSELTSEVIRSFGDSRSTGDVADHTVELGKRLLELPKWMREHYLWQRMLSALLAIYRTYSTNAVEDELKYLADLDLDRQQQRYSLVRILIWATPMLGFLGTVLGISQALGGISVGADNNFQQMMDGLRGSLYVAFDTTALALTLSMILMFGQFLIERFESQLLDLVDQRAKQEINSQFDMTVSTPEAAYGNIALDFLNASRESIELQTDSWRQTIHSAHAAWMSSIGETNDQVQNRLTTALDQSVSNLARSLGETIDKADTAMSHRWGQWQVTLSDNARLMANYQEQLSKQTELIHQSLAESKSKESLQPALDQNREAAEATLQLRQTLDDLAIALSEFKKSTVPVGEVDSPEKAMTAATDVKLNGQPPSSSSSSPTTVSFSNQEITRRIRSISGSESRSEAGSKHGQSMPEVILPSRPRFRKIITVRDPSNRNSKRAA